MKILDKLALKIHNKIYGHRCDVHPGIKYFDETHFNGLKKDAFEFINDNNYKLVGGIYHYDNYDKNTLIVFCHGMGGGHQAYMKEIEYVARNGFQVLALDYQGTILSEGDKLEGFARPLYDMDACIKKIKSQYKNIFVIGHSWGGWIAQGLCFFNMEITKVIMLAGLNSIKDCFDQYVPNYLAFIRKPLFKIESNKYSGFAETNAIQTLSRKDLKGLIIHSKDDKIVWCKNNFLKIKNNITNPNISFLLVDHKNHNPHYQKESVDYLVHYLHTLNKLKSIDDIRALKDKTDFDKMSMLDINIMNQIIDFLKD